MLKNVKITTFPSLLDLLAPHSCLGCGRLGSILCDRCKNYILAQHSNICPNCKKPRSSNKCSHCKNLPPIYIVGSRHELLDNLIHTYKYDSVRALSKIFAELLDQILPQDLPQNTCIVPLPTSTKHIRERSLDHTLLIAKHLAKLRHFQVRPILERNKNTVQVGASRTTRLAQATDAYIINHNFKPDSNTTYLLLDDIWTTGASMLSALQKLHSAGAKNVQIALLAYSELS